MCIFVTCLVCATSLAYNGVTGIIHILKWEEQTKTRQLIAGLLLSPSPLPATAAISVSDLDNTIAYPAQFNIMNTTTKCSIELIHHYVPDYILNCNYVHMLVVSE